MGHATLSVARPAIRYPHIILSSATNTLTGLLRWNALPARDAMKDLLPCCGSESWAEALVACRPIEDEPSLLALSDRTWLSLPREAWQQAFDSHPRLGEHNAKAASARSLAWSSQEQSRAEPTEALREANVRYEARFGWTFLLCANGRTSSEITAALEARMGNDPETEWREAGEQQRLITRLRLRRWLDSAV